MEEGKSFDFLLPEGLNLYGQSDLSGSDLSSRKGDHAEYEDYEYQVQTQLLGLENIVMFCSSDCGRNVFVRIGQDNSSVLHVVPVRCWRCVERDGLLEFVDPAVVEANNSQTLAVIKDMCDVTEHVFKVVDDTEAESIQLGSTGPVVARQDVIGCCEVLSSGEALEGLYESLKQLYPSETVEFYSVVGGTLDVAVQNFLCDGSPMDGLREMSEEVETGECSRSPHLWQGGALLMGSERAGFEEWLSTLGEAEWREVEQTFHSCQKFNPVWKQVVEHGVRRGFSVDGGLTGTEWWGPISISSIK
jgi:hypothetical protein